MKRELPYGVALLGVVLFLWGLTGYEGSYTGRRGRLYPGSFSEESRLQMVFGAAFCGLGVLTAIGKIRNPFDE